MHKLADPGRGHEPPPADRTVLIRAQSYRLETVHVPADNPAFRTNPDLYTLHQLEIMEQRPFTIMADVMEGIGIRNIYDNPQFSTWATTFQHKLLIYLSLFPLVAYKHPDERHFVKATLTELLRYVREVIAQTHPKEARMIVDVFAGDDERYAKDADS